MMSRLSSVVKRHPIITFFVLAYVLAWGATPGSPSGLTRRYSPPSSSFPSPRASQGSRSLAYG